MTELKVGIKFRPLLESESAEQLKWKVSGNHVESTNGKHNLVFENVFAQGSNEETYDQLVRPIVSKALLGYNGTIFAYGQTSSGKTFTMTGDNKEQGIIHAAVKDIFEQIRKDETRRFSIRIGYVEIYNDKIYDLFNKRKTGMNVFEVDGMVTINQKEFSVETENEVFKRFLIGNRCRRVVETSINKRSSRSHTIFRITIESHQINGNGESKTANLFLVDLAGSEKPDSTKVTFKEGLYINRSLLVLGKIIRELSKKKSNLQQVNFRECKLTRILSPALGGNSLTVVICTVSPTVFEETYRTICFAQNARKAKTNPIFNSTPKPTSVFKSSSFESSGCTSSTIKHVRFMLPELTSSESSSAKLLVPKKLTVPRKDLRRSRIPTLGGSDSDLSMPRKKVRQVATSTTRCTLIARRRIVQSIKYNLNDKKIFYENKQQVTNEQEATFETTESNNEFKKMLKQKDDEIESLKNQIESLREQFFKHRNTFKMKLDCKDAAIDTMTTMHIDNMTAVNEQINSLHTDIAAFEKELFAKHVELKEMEMKACKAREHTNQMTVSFDKKFKDCHKQYEKLLLKRKEEIEKLQLQLEKSEREMKLKRDEDLITYIKIEKHFEMKMKEALDALKEKKENMQQSFENKVKEQESFFQQIISEKDEEIDALRAELSTTLMNSTSISSNFSLSSMSQQSVNEQIESLHSIVSESFHELENITDDYSKSRLAMIFNQIISLIRDVKHYIALGEAPTQAHSAQVSNVERNPSVIRGVFCPHCHSSFSRKIALDRHIQSKHSNSVHSFACDECAETFKTTSGLNNHKTKIHRI